MEIKKITDFGGQSGKPNIFHVSHRRTLQAYPLRDDTNKEGDYPSAPPMNGLTQFDIQADVDPEDGDKIVVTITNASSGLVNAACAAVAKRNGLFQNSPSEQVIVTPKGNDAFELRADGLGPIVRTIAHCADAHGPMLGDFLQNAAAEISNELIRDLAAAGKTHDRERSFCRDRKPPDVAKGGREP